MVTEVSWVHFKQRKTQIGQKSDLRPFSAKAFNYNSHQQAVSHDHNIKIMLLLASGNPATMRNSLVTID